MAPSEASRSARLAAWASPRSRSSSNALSKSPPASANACLASIMPTPAARRSFCTSLAVNSGIGLLLLLRLLVVALRLDHAALGGDLLAFDCGLGDGAGQQFGGADGVVVSGDDEVDQGGEAVAVDQSDHRDAEAGCI